MARNKKLGASWLLGAVWGLGHSITIFLVGAAIIVFKIVIPPRLGLAMESAVGLVLIALGIFNMLGFSLGAIGLKAHSHGHDHHDPDHAHLPAIADHAHAHVHLRDVPLGWLRSIVRDAGLFQLARSLAVGLAHGLAGSAAVALLVLAAIPDPRAAVAYLLIFGAGTLCGMLIMSTFMEYSMLSLSRWWPRADRLMSFGTGLLSAVFGFWVVYKFGWNGGLFGPHPNWTPE